MVGTKLLVVKQPSFCSESNKTSPRYIRYALGGGVLVLCCDGCVYVVVRVVKDLLCATMLAKVQLFLKILTSWRLLSHSI